MLLKFRMESIKKTEVKSDAFEKQIRSNSSVLMFLINNFIRYFEQAKFLKYIPHNEAYDR